MVDTRWLFTVLLALMVAERLAELRVARRNHRWLVAHGAIEMGREHYSWMVILHSLFLVSCLIEVWWLDRSFYPSLALVMLVALAGAMVLRYWVIMTLGRRWTTRVLCLPGEPLITTGPYRYLRHPNYLAVAVEIFALPMIHMAWLTALVFSLANAWLLSHRVRVEEAGLQQHSESDSRFESSKAQR